MANPSVEVWNWYVDGLVVPVEIHTALAAVLAHPVVPLAAADPARLPVEAVLCDVWHGGGDFPTGVDCYCPPEEVAEAIAVAAFARRLGRRCLLPDDTLDPGRFLLAAPDGTLRPVHVDVGDDEHGPTLTGLRMCTWREPRVPEQARCRQSRWAPDSIIAGPAAA